MGFERHSMTVLGSENRADFAMLELELTGARFSEDNPQEIRRKVEPWCVPICILTGLILLIICLPLTQDKKDRNASKLHNSEPLCNETCRPQLALQNPNLPKLHSVTAIEIMVPSLDHLAKYFSFNHRRNDTAVIDNFLETVLKNRSNSTQPLTINILTRFSYDNMLIPDGMTKEYLPHLAQLTFRNGSTIVRLKNASLPIAVPLWIIDGSSFYLDWGSVGLQGTGCRCVAVKLSRLFHLFWHATIDNRLVDGFFTEMGTNWLPRTGGVCLPNAPSGLLSVSPEFLSQRTALSSALVTLSKTVEEAREFVLLIVPAYDPTVTKLSNDTVRLYWPVVDNFIRQAVHNQRLSIKILVHSFTPNADLPYLRSLLALNGLPKGTIRTKVWSAETLTTETSFPVVITGTTITFGTSSVGGDPYFRNYGLSLTLQRAAHNATTDRCHSSQSDLMKPMLVAFSESSVEDIWFAGVEMFRTLWDNASDHIQIKN